MNQPASRSGERNRGRGDEPDRGEQDREVERENEASGSARIGGSGQRPRRVIRRRGVRFGLHNAEHGIDGPAVDCVDGRRRFVPVDGGEHRRDRDDVGDVLGSELGGDRPVERSAQSANIG